jgi:hypothetical protein
MAFNLPFALSCVEIAGALFIFFATRKTDGQRRLAIILLCCAFLVAGVSGLLGLRGENRTFLFGASGGFTLSALLVVILMPRRPV